MCIYYESTKCIDCKNTFESGYDGYFNPVSGIAWPPEGPEEKFYTKDEDGDEEGPYCEDCISKAKEGFQCA